MWYYKILSVYFSVLCRGKTLGSSASHNNIHPLEHAVLIVPQLDKKHFTLPGWGGFFLIFTSLHTAGEALCWNIT